MTALLQVVALLQVAALLVVLLLGPRHRRRRCRQTSHHSLPARLQLELAQLHQAQLALPMELHQESDDKALASSTTCLRGCPCRAFCPYFCSREPPQGPGI